MILKKLHQLRYVKNYKQVWRYFTSEVKSIEIAVTYNCNFKCRSCYAEDLQKDIFMPKEKVLEFIKQYKPMHVNLTGGEPLLHKEIFSIIKEIPKSVVVSMVTNGSLLTREVLKTLKESGLNTIQISFGKNYPEKHNTEMAEYAERIGINVSLSVTNTFENKEYIEKAISLAEEGNFHVLFNLPYGELENEFDKETYIEYRLHPLVREDNMFWRGWNKCPAGTSKIYISADGFLMPCDRLHKIYSSYNIMKEDYKDNDVFCTRWGNIL